MPWVLFVFIMSGIIWWLKELKGDIALFKRWLRVGMYYIFSMKIQIYQKIIFYLNVRWTKVDNMRQNEASVYLKNKWLTSSSLAQSWKSASESGVRLELGDSSFKIDSTHYTVTHHEYGHEYAGKNMPCAKNKSRFHCYQECQELLRGLQNQFCKCITIRSLDKASQMTQLLFFRYNHS